MSKQKITKFIDSINTLQSDNVTEVLQSIYTDKVNFVDPVKSIMGLAELTRYFEHLYKHVDHCQFTLKSYVLNEQDYSLEWVMNMRHKKIAKSREIILDGASFIQFSNGKVCYHRDYYDLGALVYEQIPVLGTVVKRVRNAI